MKTIKSISVIEPIVTVIEKPPQKPVKRKVAAYARVSTDKDEQQGSYEAQIDYFTKLIESNDDWEFVKVYSDEGLSGTSTRLRKGFQSMIRDALSGHIDLIVTKSISRFARNTVDSLTTIRTLKEAGVECFFEKENIYTFDPKGELLITILSSLAQEESRSLSENVTWGARKRFADGKYTIHYSEFLGYRKGGDGTPEIDESEASVIRRIYCMCIEGLGYYEIAKALTNDGIRTPMGKKVWGYSVVKSILQNEKYIGDALLQKTVSVSYLTKKRVKNEGFVQQYYVKGGHPAIISEEFFKEAQAAQQTEREKPRRSKNGKAFSKRILCAGCGKWYIEAVWNPNTKYEKRIWRCKNRTKYKTCRAPVFTADQARELFLNAGRELARDQALYTSVLPRLYTPARVLEVCRMEMTEIEKAGYTPDTSPRLLSLLSFIKSREELNRNIEKALLSSDLSSLPAAVPDMLIDYIEVFADGETKVHFQPSPLGEGVSEADG